MDINVNWVTENREGGFLGHELKPKRQEFIWVSDSDMCTLTPEEADALCSRLPIWDDQEPTPVKHKGLKTFEECCEYLGISEELPKCQVDERQIQATYKLRVCMKAWNKIDGFELDEKASYYEEGAGYTPYFLLRDGNLLSSGHANNGSSAGIVTANAPYSAANTYENFGLRLSLKTRERAVAFGKVFIETFNELI